MSRTWFSLSCSLFLPFLLEELGRRTWAHHGCENLHLVGQECTEVISGAETRERKKKNLPRRGRTRGDGLRDVHGQWCVRYVVRCRDSFTHDSTWFIVAIVFDVCKIRFQACT